MARTVKRKGQYLWPPGTRRSDPWVFAYGSLMWKPGFAHVAAKPGRLYGFHRALCMWSVHYRGTARRPGLVLGLSPGGSCLGRCFRIERARWPGVFAKLYRREMITGMYRQQWCRVAVDEGRAGRRGKRRVKKKIWALAFLSDRAHPQYAGKLPDEVMLAAIAKAKGRKGRSREYLADLVRHLDELGIRDGPLHRLHRRLEDKAGR
jgi:cation transport protein ChaC